MGLGGLIENAIKLLQKEQSDIQDAGSNGEADENEEEALFDYEKDEEEVTDEDHEAFYQYEQELEQQDNDYLLSLLGDEEEE